MPRTRSAHHERHAGDRSGWLRAAVLGANDAIVSTASLMLGVAEADAARSTILVTGIAGLVAGAMSMAAGEFVSVSSQRDAEEADIALERQELKASPQAEVAELAQIYVRRGLGEDLARAVAEQLMARDQLGAHLRDELNIDPNELARPWQAAASSATSFAAAALVPILALLAAPAHTRVPAIGVASLIALAALGALGAHLGGAPKLRASARVVLGGALAMTVTSVVGHVVGVSL